MSNPPIVLNLMGATLSLTGVLLAIWLWPDGSDYNHPLPGSAVPALTILGLFLVGAMVSFTGAAIVKALGQR